MTGSFTLVLPLLLLPLVFSSPLQSSVPCPGMHEFRVHLNKLNNKVKHNENCSSIHITDKCKRFNLTASIGKFPDYFINGLKSLNHSNHSERDINQLIRRLEIIPRCQNKINLTSLFVKYEPVISPVDLLQKLDDLTQQIKSLQSQE